MLFRSIEPGGLVGHSVYCGTPLESHIPADDMDRYVELGREYLARTNFGAYNRYAQAQRSRCGAVRPVLLVVVLRRRAGGTGA